MIPCRGAADIAEAAAVLTQQPLPGGFRVGVVTNAGGMGVLDRRDGRGRGALGAAAVGLAAVGARRPVVGADNPVDLGADVTPLSLAAALELLLDSGEVDAAVVTLVPTVLADPVALRAAVAAAALAAGQAGRGRRLGRPHRRGRCPG